MANPLQIAKNASKLIVLATAKRDKEFEKSTNTIIKAVVAELHTTLKGKPVSELLTLEDASLPFEFDTYGFLDDVNSHHNKLALPGGSYTKGETLRIKRITWDGKPSDVTPDGSGIHVKMFNLMVYLDNGITESMECIVHID
jgi:hypothetical protein